MAAIRGFSASLPAKSVSGSLFVGVAGWSIRREHAGRFPATGSHLERYARVFPAVEINSSFYRHHRPATYARWAESVPAGFRFAVKVPKEITHERRLVRSLRVLDRFLREVRELGVHLGPLLLQFPPSFAFDGSIVRPFLAALRKRTTQEVVCEPRHASWFTPAVERLLVRFQIARAAVDPAVVPEAAKPGGWPGLAYYRLHGSPRMYYSAYSSGYLRQLAAEMNTHTNAWCIFDNTALGAATLNGIALLRRLSFSQPR